MKLERVLYGLVILVPITLILRWTGAAGPIVFVASALALIPLAALLGKATEVVASSAGPAIGALMNATFGNAAELIITIVALREGLIDIVKASIAGSIVGNILIVVGLSALFGGFKNGIQTFDARTASTHAGLMSLAVVSLAIPAVFSIGAPDHNPTRAAMEDMSIGVALALMLAYGLFILYTLRNQNPASVEFDAGAAHEPGGLSLPLAIGLLGGATVAVVVMSEVLVGVLEPTAEVWGLGPLFVGVILVPIVGNVAEHVVAVQAAVKNQMDLSLGIAIGSALQIALFVAPVLVLVSHLVGHPMTLVFNSFELTALIASGLIAVIVSVDGESNWLEGAILTILYVIIALAFFFLP